MDSDKIKIRHFLISLAALFFIEAGGAILLKYTPLSMIIRIGILRLAEIIIFILIFFIEDNDLSALGLASSQILPGIKKGLVWSFGFGVLVVAGAVVIYLFGVNPFRLIHTHIPKHLSDLIVFILIAGFIAPIAEELFFRGIIYGFLRYMGVFAALFISTLIFALLHSKAGITQIIGGILFAVAYEAEEKLMVPITIHIIGNIAIFTVSLLS